MREQNEQRLGCLLDTAVVVVGEAKGMAVTVTDEVLSDGCARCSGRDIEIGGILGC